MDFLRNLFLNKSEQPASYEGSLLRGQLMHRNRGESIPMEVTMPVSKELEKTGQRRENELSTPPQPGYTEAGIWNGEEQPKNALNRIGTVLYLSEGIKDAPAPEDVTSFSEHFLNKRIQSWEEDKNDLDKPVGSIKSELKRAFVDLLYDLREKNVQGLASVTIARVFKQNSATYYATATMGESPVYAVQKDGSVVQLSKHAESNRRYLGKYLVLTAAERERAHREKNEEVTPSPEGDTDDQNPEYIYTPEISIAKLPKDTQAIFITTKTFDESGVTPQLLSQYIAESKKLYEDDWDACAKYIVQKVVGSTNSESEYRSEYSAIFLPATQIENDEKSDSKPVPEFIDPDPSVTEEFVRKILDPDEITTLTLLIRRLREVENYDFGPRENGRISKEKSKPATRIIDFLLKIDTKLNDTNSDEYKFAQSSIFDGVNRTFFEERVTQLLQLTSLTRQFELRKIAIRLVTDKFMDVHEAKQRQ